MTTTALRTLGTRDLPLVVVFTIVVLSLTLNRIHDVYIYSLMSFMVWTSDRAENENTYYSRICDGGDVTTQNLYDLRVEPNESTYAAVEKILTHGVSMLPQLLANEDVDSLRKHVIRRNAQLSPSDSINVIAREYRWSFGPSASEHPSIPKVLSSLATHSTLRPILESLLGPNPALIEMSTITSSFGAEAQYWHADVSPDGSALKFGATFVPIYSLLIPLQDTSDRMGATSVCPGTHFCVNNLHECNEIGFQVANSTNTFEKGHGILYSAQLRHRGAAHVDPHAPDRAVLILTFAPRPGLYYPEGGTGPRMRLLPLGASYAIRWDHWGFTLNDLVDASSRMSWPRTVLRALGIRKCRHCDWGWDFITFALSQIVNSQDNYQEQDLQRMVRSGSGFFGKLPWFLRGSIYLDTDFNAWHMFLIGTLNAIVKWSIVVYLAIMAIIVLDAKKSFREGKGSELVFWILARLVIHAFVVYVACMELENLSQSQWGLDIRSGRLDASPFPVLSEKEITNRYVDALVSPRASDVLIATRTSAFPLDKATGLFLHYHRGNIQFRRDSSALAPLYKSYEGLPSAFRIALCDALVHGPIEDSGLRRRVLIQDKFGNWKEMTHAKSRSYAKRSFSLDDDGGVLRIMSFEFESLLANCR